MNVFASYAFARQLEDRGTAPSVGKQLADLSWERQRKAANAA